VDAGRGKSESAGIREEKVEKDSRGRKLLCELALFLEFTGQRMGISSLKDRGNRDRRHYGRQGQTEEDSRVPICD
jgi:hypothetical protein